MRFAPEGIPFVAASVILLAVWAAVAWLAGGGWMWLVPAVWMPMAISIAWFFRDPQRSGERGEHLVIAPADGKVVAIADVEEPSFIRGPARRVSVFMNVFDVHVNRYPVDGTVEHRDYRPGKFLNATLDKASSENEQMTLSIRTHHGPVLVRQIAGLVARRIVTDARVGDAVLQGERLGLIRFGSRVDTLLPAEARIRVAVGDRALAGVTVIAEWPT